MNCVRPLFSCLPAIAAAALLGTSLCLATPAAAEVGRPLLMPRMLSTAPSLGLPSPGARPSGKIKHVIIILQENRSFDDLFQGYPGADTQSYGYDSNGNKIALAPVPLEAPYDIEHDITSFTTAYNNGNMNGFNNEPNGCGPHCVDPQYGYVPASETLPYFKMASQYVLADRMFTSHIDDSFISHQYIIAAQANGTAYFPSTTWGCDGGPNDQIYTLTQERQFGPTIQVCWDINTLGDELDQAHLKWRFYTSTINGDGGLWSSYQAIRHIRYGPDWAKDIITPQSTILTDIASGKLDSMSWVTPTCTTSDHGGCDSNDGPAWVTSIVNAVGESKLWKSTAIFVMWDEWGGWYDHVPPPYVDYDGLGFRVPLLMISPYAKQGYVTHVQYEHGSLLRFVEDQYGLGQLSASDTRANDPATDAFDFTQKPREFVPFASKRAPGYFLHAPVDTRVPDSE